MKIVLGIISAVLLLLTLISMEYVGITTNPDGVKIEINVQRAWSDLQKLSPF